MRVAELRALLDLLPDDMYVHINSNHCSHVDTAERAPRCRLSFPEFGVECSKPALILRGKRLWADDEPEWRLRGPWPRAADEIGLGIDTRGERL